MLEKGKKLLQWGKSKVGDLVSQTLFRNKLEARMAAAREANSACAQSWGWVWCAIAASQLCAVSLSVCAESKGKGKKGKKGKGKGKETSSSRWASMRRVVVQPSGTSAAAAGAEAETKVKASSALVPATAGAGAGAGAGAAAAVADAKSGAGGGGGGFMSRVLALGKKDTAAAAGAASGGMALALTPKKAGGKGVPDVAGVLGVSLTVSVVLAEPAPLPGTVPSSDKPSPAAATTGKVFLYTPPFSAVVTPSPPRCVSVRRRRAQSR